LQGKPLAPVVGFDLIDGEATVSKWQTVRVYLPPLVRAAAITMALSCLSMALAIIIGVSIASGRIYGGKIAGSLLTAYVEIIRGTPILLQLFILYYGIVELIRLPAFVAALLGLGLNYAAYESEIYRGALEAVPGGQLEAARILGFSELQVLTVLELTKQTQIFATNIGSWVVPGALCAALYMAMSLPLAALAHRLEQRWRRRTA
jgi:His/Glu/Gln/Arg/opine family amino acid ABC transporter permease subunit